MKRPTRVFRASRCLPPPCWCCCRRSPGCSTRGSTRLPTPIASAARARCRPRRRSSRRTSTARSARRSSACSSSRAWSSRGPGPITPRAIKLWADSAVAPEIVKSVYFVEAPEGRPAARIAPLRVWNAQTRTFEPTRWPAELAPLRARFTHESRAVVSFQIPAPATGASARSAAVAPSD